ncbi:MAG: hypothetical protein KatS3mg014_2040 [Actinomycetota bacterium]|nr:MAG: hypothetical protein KatS3mg014_2040 [Actinomycetota bacterium]
MARAQRIQLRLRAAKQEMFHVHVMGDAGGSLLDVGGGDGIAGEWAHFYRRFTSVVTLNLDRGQEASGVIRVVGDGTAMPFRDCSFDFVLCNAVLEHVPYGRQRALADEIRRVARAGYLVATPHKWFPIDPHTFLPYYQVLSAPIQERYVRLARGYLRRFEPLYPLGRRDLVRLFPEAEVRTLKLAALPAQLVALWRRGGLLAPTSGGRSA